MSDSLTAQLRYDMENDKFTLTGNIKPEGVAEIAETFLRGQMGKGADDSPANKTGPYLFEITWTPHMDVIDVAHNCKNKGLRDGILMHFLKHHGQGMVVVPEKE